jgi:hypothetical protein
VQIILIDIFMNGVLYYTLKILEFILLSPIALIGLFVEYSRSGFVKVNRKFRKVDSSPELNINISPSKISEDRSPLNVIVRISDLILKQRENKANTESISSNESSKINKKHGALDFLMYLKNIKAHVYLYDKNN